MLHGVEEVNISAKSFKERIDEAQNPAIEIIRNRFPNEGERIIVTDKVYAYVGACQDVYMEIGMQCGAALAMQMFGPESMVGK